jgi:hypothetical protein
MEINLEMGMEEEGETDFFRLVVEFGFISKLEDVLDGKIGPERRGRRKRRRRRGSRR